MASEFGKGLVLCLVKFAEHRAKWVEQRRLWEDMKTKTDDKTLFTESGAIEIHMSGASDHLYEIEVPEAWKKKKIGNLVKKLQDKGLDMGHGFSERDKTWTEADIIEVYELTQEIAMLIDKELGLKPQKGTW